MAPCALLEEQPVIQLRVPVGPATAFVHSLQRVSVFAGLMLGRAWAHAVTQLMQLPGCESPVELGMGVFLLGFEHSPM